MYLSSTLGFFLNPACYACGKSVWTGKPSNRKNNLTHHPENYKLKAELWYFTSCFLLSCCTKSPLTRQPFKKQAVSNFLKVNKAKKFKVGKSKLTLSCTYKITQSIFGVTQSATNTLYKHTQSTHSKENWTKAPFFHQKTSRCVWERTNSPPQDGDGGMFIKATRV